MAPAPQSGREALADHGDGHVVRDKVAFRNVRLGMLSQFGLVLHVFAEQVTRRDVDKTGLFGQ